MNRLIWLFLIATRLRDRLRCPNCGAVGTYKLHAPPPKWRWLCKYCGYYRDKDGVRACVPSPTFGCWIFADQEEGFKGKTPKTTVEHQSAMDWTVAGSQGKLRLQTVTNGPYEVQTYHVWPWRG